MKRILAVLVLASATMAYGQNKTFSVGTPTPNPNAALHVESPTNNQGFIMPRLTTAQRTAMGAALTAVDAGVMVYDTNAKGIYIWEGAKWETSAKITWPLTDTITVAPNRSNLLDITYNGTDTVGIARFRSTNANNTFSALFMQSEGGRIVFGTTNATNSPGAEFRNLNAANAQPALRTSTVGTGNAANFSIANATNNVAALRASTNGIGNAANFSITNAASAAAAINSTTNGSGAGIFAQNTGVGNGFAGLFNTTQATNTFPAIQASTVGSGTGMRVIQNAPSVGGGMDVFMQNPLSTAAGMAITQQGLGDGLLVNINTADTTFMAGVRSTNTSFGNAGYFQTTNANSPSPAVLAISNSLNGPLEAVQNGAVGPIARVFSNDPTNTSDGIIINMNGTGNAINANRPIVAPSFIGDGSGLTNLPAVSFPLSTTVNSAAPLFDINASGTASAGRFINTNPANTLPALFAETAGSDAAIVGQTFTGFASIYGRREGATNGNAGFFEITDAGNTFPALQTTTVGSGPAGSFLLNRAGSVAHALYAQSNGDSTFAAVHGNNVGNGFGVFGKSAGTKFASAAVYGLHTGTGDAAGAFRISNPANTYSALFGETNGSGPAIFANQLGTGRAGQFQIGNVANSQAALRSFTSGTGRAGFFTISNPTNDNAALMAETNGVGAAVFGLNSGPGDSFSPAGHFVVNNATNTHAAVQGNNDGNGPAGRFLIQSAANTAIAVDASTTGTGAAGSFNISNPSSGAPAVIGVTNGAGIAVSGVNNGTGPAMYARAAGANDALFAEKQAGDAVGSAGNFLNNNASNNASTLFAATNAPTGHAIGAINSANGNAFSIFQGGMKVSTATLNATISTVISTRAAAYYIEDATSPFTFSGGVTLNEGEMIYIFNGDLLNNATIEGFTLAPEVGVTAIYMSGALRFFRYIAP